MNIPMNLPKKALLLVALCAVVLIGAFYFYSTNPQTLSAANSAATFQGKQVDLIVDSSQIPDTYLAKGPSLKLPTALKTSITKVSSSSKGAVTSEKLAAATQLCPSQWDEDGKCYKYVASNVADVTNVDCSKLSGIAKSTCLLKAKAKQAVKLTCNQDAAVPLDQETKECGEKPQTQQPTKTPTNQSAPANGSFKSGNLQITCPNKYNGKIDADIGDGLCYVGFLFTPNRAGELPIATRNLLSGNLYIAPDFASYLTREKCMQLIQDLVTTGVYPTFQQDPNAANHLRDCLNSVFSDRLISQNADGSSCFYAPLRGQVTSPCEVEFQQQCKPTNIDGICKTGFMARNYGISVSVSDDTKIHNSLVYEAGLKRQYCPGLIIDNLKTGRTNTHIFVDRRLGANTVEYKTAAQARGVIDDGLGFYVVNCEISLSQVQGNTCVYAPTDSSECKSNVVSPVVKVGAQVDLTLLDGAVERAGQNVPLGVSGASSDSATSSLIRNGLIGRTNSPVIGVISNARDRLSAGIQDGLAQVGAHDGDAIPIDKIAVYNRQVEDICPSKIVQDKCYVAYLANASGIPFSPADFEQMQTTLNLNYTSSFNSTFDVATLQKCKATILDDIAHGIRTTPAKLAECALTKTRRIAGRDPYCLYAPGKTNACNSVVQNEANQNENPVALPANSLVISPIKVTKVNTFGFSKNVDVKWSTQPKANYTLVLKSLIGGLALTKLQSEAMTLDNAVKLSAKPGSYNVSVLACAGNKNCKVAYAYFKVAATGVVSIINVAPAAANGELSNVNLFATQLPKEGQHFVVNVSWITNVNANATLTVINLVDESNVPVAAPLGYNKGRFVKLPIHESLVPSNFKASITSCTAANVCLSNETLFNVNANGVVASFDCDPLTMAQCPPLRDSQQYDLTIDSYIWAVSGLKLTLTNPNTDAITITEVSVGGDPGQNFVPVELQPDETKVINWPYGCGISGYQAGDQYNEDLVIKYDSFLGPQSKYVAMQGGCSDVLNPYQDVNGANAELAFNATLTGLQVTQNTLDLTWEATLPNSHNLTLYEIDSNARLNQIQSGDLNGVRIINIASPLVVDGVLMLDGNSPFRLNVPGLKPNTLYLGFMTVCAAPNLGLQCVDLDIQAFTRDAAQTQFESDTCPIRKVNGKCTASVQISKAGVAQANRVELYPRDAALRKFIQLTMDNTLDQECLEQAFALSYGGFDELNILYSIRGFAVPFQVENDIYKLVNANIADGICNLRLDRNADGSYCLGYPATAALCNPNVNDVGGFPVIQGPDFTDPVQDIPAVNDQQPVNGQDVPVAANGDSGDRGSSARIRNGNNNYLLFPCEQTHLCPPEQTTPSFDDGSSNGGFVDSTPVQQPVQKPVTKPPVKEPTKDKPIVEESNFVDSQAVLIAAVITLALLLGGLFFAFKRK